MIDLIGTIVEVGTGEALYVGKLVEMNEYEIHLEAESGWVVVPIERIAFVRPKEEADWIAP
ncbi:MAG: hypothetical protein HZB31_14615 [Nitrospirae bacterium]|nr:hypothetical protein [Nitrospirota bacterium]